MLFSLVTTVRVLRRIHGTTGASASASPTAACQPVAAPTAAVADPAAGSGVLAFTFARSFKEAQGYSGMRMLVPMLPGILATIYPRAQRRRAPSAAALAALTARAMTRGTSSSSGRNVTADAVILGLLVVSTTLVSGNWLAADDMRAQPRTALVAPAGEPVSIQNIGAYAWQDLRTAANCRYLPDAGGSGRGRHQCRGAVRRFETADADSLPLAQRDREIALTVIGVRDSPSQPCPLG